MTRPTWRLVDPTKSRDTQVVYEGRSREACTRFAGQHLAGTRLQLEELDGGWWCPSGTVPPEPTRSKGY